MSVAEGNRVYSNASVHHSAFEIVWTNKDLDAALSGLLGDVLSDPNRIDDIESTLDGLAETEFEATGVRRILASREELTNWRVGEMLSLVYLQEHQRCLFPWPTGRDNRKAGSSLPGADLAGFTGDEAGYCFAFGETKTSSERRYPPRVMHGDDGRISQLKALRDDQSIRDKLVRYLLFKSASSPWMKQYQSAAKRYISDPTDISIYGLLIRDVESNSKDLHGLGRKFIQTATTRTRLKLIAIYLPTDSLSSGKTRVISRSANNEF